MNIYREKIIQMVKNIKDKELLKKIYTFVQVFYEYEKEQDNI